jgi:hypothetical protein
LACECDEGYQQNALGECEAADCGSIRPSTPNGADTPACCDKWGWVWDDRDGCVCPASTFWDPNSAECQPNCEENPSSLNNLRQTCCEQLEYVWVSQSNECTCPENMVWSDDDKECVPDCGETQPTDPATITTQTCCEHWKNAEDQNIWVWDTENATCGCPEGQFWNAELQKCIEYEGCVYQITVSDSPEIKHSAAECAYTLSFTGSNGGYTFVPVPGSPTCPSNKYCMLFYEDGNCETRITNFTARTYYGTCKPLSYSQTQGDAKNCPQWVEWVPPTYTRIRGCQNTNQYCSDFKADPERTTNVDYANLNYVYGRCVNN